MSHRVFIICNPKSGNGLGQKKLDQTVAALKQFQLDPLTFLATPHNQVNIITQQLSRRYKLGDLRYLLVIGGDGMLHDVVQAFIQIGIRIPITYIPAGTGNDFARVWYPNISLRETIEVLVYNDKAIDIPIIHYDNHFIKEKGVILNSMGFGFDAIANYKAMQLRYDSFFSHPWLGPSSYLAGLVMSLSKIPHFKVTGRADGHDFEISDASIFSVMNSPYVGGGIKLTNQCSPRMHHMTLVSYQDITSAAVRDLIPKVLWKNAHDKSEYIHQRKAYQLSLKIDTAIRGQVDGEDIAPNPVQIDFKMGTYPFRLPPVKAMDLLEERQLKKQLQTT